MKNDITGNATIIMYAPASRVWKYLTDPELIKQYFFGTNVKTSWEVGTPITFEGEYDGKKYQDKGTILAFEEGKMIRYNYWSSMSGIEDKSENYGVITFDLFAGFNKTILTLTQENIATEQMKEHSEQNWMQVFNALKKLVEE